LGVRILGSGRCQYDYGQGLGEVSTFHGEFPS
jgi:hypothetical protein